MSKFDIGVFLSQNDQLKRIDIDLLVPYRKHRFGRYTGERLEDMINSIKENGVLTPIIVRPAPEGGGRYEILAGHNRCNAAKAAGLEAVPGIVKEGLSDEEAEMYVIETNLMQRGFNDLALSERAAAVAMRHSQMFDPQKRREIRWKLNAIERMENEPERKSKLALTGEEYSLSKNTVARLIRIHKLIETCDKYELSVDSGGLSVRAAVELSYITSKTALEVILEKYGSSIVIDNAQENIARIDVNKALWLREIFDGFEGDREQAESMLNDRHRERTINGIEQTAAKPVKISVPTDIFRKYFTEETRPDEAADIIDKALEMYFSQNMQRNE